MIVWPDSWSVQVLKVGSSSASFDKAIPIFSLFALSFGSIAISITGSGNSIDSRMIGCAGSHNVSPVPTSFNPTAAAISPAYTLSISSLWFECINRILPILSFLSLFAFKIVEPASNVPEYTLKKQIFPTNGSVAILNAKAANGSLSDVFLSASLPSMSTPLISAISSGDGINSTTAFNSSCTPLFL